VHPSIHRYAPGLILLASFLLLAVFYDSLPPEVIITRGIFGDVDTVAPRSLFTVFRVPLIDAICATAAAVLLQKFSLVAPPLARFWLILLYTAACKALLQACEIVSPPGLADVFFYLTIAFVAAGIIAAFAVAARHLSGLVKGLGRFSAVETVVLAMLLVAYLGVAIVPSFVYR
jgi:hypothetical protein